MFGERLKETRKRYGLTQQMLSIKSGISQTTISGWEKGNKVPSADSVVHIAKIFGVTTDYLLGLTNAPITVHTTNTPYMQLSKFESDLMLAYRNMTVEEQRIVCRTVGLDHPAAAHAASKKA